MLKPEYLSKVPASMVELYSQVEMDILTDMARRISTYDYWIPAAEHQAKMLEEMGMVREEIISHLKGLTGKSKKELTALMEVAAEVALKSDDAVYKRNGLNPGPVRASKSLQKVLQSGYKRTQKLFNNLTLTTANTATKQFENALNRAYMQIALGGMDYNSAIRSTIKELSKQGVGAIEYPSGKIDNLETAVRRATITGVNQTALKMQEARADEMDCDLVETSAHAGARPSHAQWQGEIFSRSGKSNKYPDFVLATGYGKGEGLGGWNCSHSFSPYFEGSSRTYTKEQLTEYQDKNYTYNGRKMTEYEALGEQRNIERNIRRWKREQSTLRATGDSTDEASAKIKSWQEREKDFLNQTGLKKQNDRSQIGGYGKSEARRTTAESEKHYKAWIGSISNEGNPKNLAAYYDMKYNNPKEYAQLKSYAKKVDTGMISPLCGFENFKKQYELIENEVIGTVTANGIRITKQSDHFIERVIGTTADPKHGNFPRSGVEVEDIAAALKNGKAKPVKYTPDREKGGTSPSQVFYNDKCVVTVNPQSGKLIQCNP
jgi:hypothetical protein